MSCFTRSSAIAVIADRTACSILTLFIVTATSRPLNKKKSVCCQSADPTITADLRPQSAVRTPLSAPAVGGFGRRSHRVTVQRHRVIVDKRADSQPESHRHLWLFYFLTRDSSFSVVHFVAKQYILQQKCLKGQIGTCVLGTRWCNF